MDIEAALTNAREAAAKVVELSDRGIAPTAAADDLAEAFQAIDGWLSSGGFLPDAWAR